jgi:hypothetical protein
MATWVEDEDRQTDLAIYLIPGGALAFSCYSDFNKI